MNNRKLNSAAVAELAKNPKGRFDIPPATATEFCVWKDTMKYMEQLSDARWIELREKIKDRDGNACVNCGSKIRLEVHHFYYVAKRMAWEYPDDCLITLCRDCHSSQTSTGKFDMMSWEKSACALLFAVRNTCISYRPFLTK